MTRPDIQHVTGLIAEASETLILPRFRRLRPEDIENKSPSAEREDLVTVVDREVEVFLTRALGSLDPGAAVVGEEAVHADATLLRRVTAERPVWIIDPIDGTRNFARGDDGFGVMVSRVEDGSTVAAWVVLPARGDAFVAEVGGGTWLNDRRLHVPGTPAPDTPRGRLMVRYMPADIRAHVTQVAHAGHLDVVPDSVCAAVEYTEIIRAEQDFAVYYRLLPWDHAAPALILTEAGGAVEHLSGEPYTVRSDNQVTVVARSREVARQMRAKLRPM